MVGSTAVCHTCNQFFAIFSFFFVTFNATEKFHSEEKVFPPSVLPHSPLDRWLAGKSLLCAGVSFEMEGFSSGWVVFPLMQRTPELVSSSYSSGKETFNHCMFVVLTVG